MTTLNTNLQYRDRPAKGILALAKPTRRTFTPTMRWSSFLLLLPVIFWGVSYIAIKVVLGELEPVEMIAVRFLCAANTPVRCVSGRIRTYAHHKHTLVVEQDV
ncbi:MAG: hypothetical protein AB1744_04730 [Candidatus Zixiibacteriota bacterium]